MKTKRTLLCQLRYLQKLSHRLLFSAYLAESAQAINVDKSLEGRNYKLLNYINILMCINTDTDIKHRTAE